jgi:hypothetical protein
VEKKKAHGEEKAGLFKAARKEDLNARAAIISRKSGPWRVPLREITRRARGPLSKWGLASMPAKMRLHAKIQGGSLFPGHREKNQIEGRQ